MTSSKKELKEKENQERLARAVETLDTITKNNDVQKSIRNMIKEVLLALKDDKGGSVSVRAANAISLLDNAHRCSLTSERCSGRSFRLWKVSENNNSYLAFFTGFTGGGSFSSLWAGLAR